MPRACLVAPFQQVDLGSQGDAAEAHVLGGRDGEVCVYRDALAVLEQGDNQVIIHALLVVREQYVVAIVKVFSQTVKV